MLQIFEDKAQLSTAAATLFVKLAREAVQQRGRFTVALTGGSSPSQLYELLAESPQAEQVPWDKTYVFWGDERWVSLTNEQSNARMAQEALLGKVPVPAEQVFPMWAEDTTPEDFAARYEEILRQHFGDEEPRFDLILLGMGEDGHTASLFPGTAVLQERSHWVHAYYLEPQAMYRVTLTAPLINQARVVCFLVFGDKKAPALHQVLEGDRNPDKYPAQLIQAKGGELLWFVDKSAAAELG